MRAYLWITLFFIVLVAPFVVRQVVSRGDTKAEQSVSAEAGALDLIVVTPHNQDVRRAFQTAFDEWHRERFHKPAHITYLNFGGSNDIVRLVRDFYGKAGYSGVGEPPPMESVNPTIDIAWGGGDYMFDKEIKPYLQSIQLPPGVLDDAFPKPDLNGVALYDRKTPAGPRWIGAVLSSFGIVYSPPIYRTLGLPEPTRWDDLTKPELNGLLALADPTRSGSVAVIYMVIMQRAMADAEQAYFKSHPQAASVPTTQRSADPAYHAALAAGWKAGLRQLVLMAANARYFTDSATQVPNDVGSADAAAGVAIDFYGRVVEETIGSDRMRFTFPRGATAITADPVGILYGVKGDHAVIANRFVEFLLTKQAQLLWDLKADQSPHLERALRRMPIRRDVYANQSNWADPTVNPFEAASNGFNIRSEWMGLYSDLRPVWACAWIDARTELKDAYAAILKVSDAKRRGELLYELSDIPVSMNELESLSKQRIAIDAGNDPDWKDSRYWAAKQRIEWGRKFRAHYAAVGARAKLVNQS